MSRCQQNPKGYFSLKVKVKVTRSLTLVSFERSMRAKYEVSISYCSKVIGKIKIDNRQTDRQTNRQNTNNMPLIYLSIWGGGVFILQFMFHVSRFKIRIVNHEQLTIHDSEKSHITNANFFLTPSRVLLPLPKRTTPGQLWSWSFIVRWGRH